jgi:hypothetical protein
MIMMGWAAPTRWSRIWHSASLLRLLETYLPEVRRKERWMRARREHEGGRICRREGR